MLPGPFRPDGDTKESMLSALSQCSLPGEWTHTYRHVTTQPTHHRSLMFQSSVPSQCSLEPGSEGGPPLFQVTACACAEVYVGATYHPPPTTHHRSRMLQTLAQVTNPTPHHVAPPTKVVDTTTHGG